MLFELISFNRNSFEKNILKPPSGGLGGDSQSERSRTMKKWSLGIQEQGHMNNTKTRFAAFFILLCLMFYGAAIYASEKNVTFGADSDFAPFSYVANNTAHGYEVDLIKLIFEKGDYQLEFIYGLTWDKIYEQTVKNQMDICGTLVRTSDRAEKVLFTDDAYTRYYGLFTNVNRANIDIDTLGNYRLGAVRGYYSEIIVRDMIKSSNYEVFDTYLQMIIALKENRIDAFIETTEVVKYYMLKNNLVGQVILQHDGLFPQSVPFGIAKDRPELVEFINKRIKEIKESGEYEIIYIKNFSAHSPEYYEAEGNKDRLIIIGISTALAAVAIAFILLLKHQIKRATEKILQRESEIKAKNVELESVNEELNATLEEMEASSEELITTSETLRNSEEKFRNLVRDMQVGVLLQGPDAGILMSNPKALELLGLSEDQLLGKTSFDPDWNVIHEDGSNFPGHTHPVPEAIASGQSVHDVVMGVYRPVSNDRVWLLVDAEPQFNRDGTINQVVCTFIDITSLKKTEDDLKKNESHLRTLLQTIPDLIWLKDKEGVYISCNIMFERFFGAKENEIIGKSDYDFMDRDRAEFFRENDRRAILAGKSVSNEEFITFADDGHSAFLDTIKTPMFDSRGDLIGVLGIGRDITERKDYEERIKSLLAEKDLLLQEVHHRIKNNMNTIKGLLTLQISSEGNTSASESLRDAESRVQSMIMLYDRLYCTDNYRELPVKDYLQRLAEEIVGSFPNRGIVKIETEIEDFILNVQALSPLGIIINELFTNMMKYAFVDRECGVIKLSAALKEKRARIVIQDNGVGIPEFISFEKSSGFGLDLVVMLTEQIGGKITIERGEGTKFILEFDV